MADAFLEMQDITKDYPGVRALDQVSIAVERGEVRALLGENGAGKSTLIKILAGATTADSGTIVLDGQPIVYRDPVQALKRGIGAIYQEFNLVPQLNIAQNIMLGQVPARMGLITSAAMHRQARAELQKLEVELDTYRLVAELTVAQQQVVEIAKGLARDLKVFIMDEPTAALNTVETEHLFNVIRALKKQGVTIIYITHRMREIFEIADTVTVLKDGKLVATRPINNVTQDDIVSMMIGRQLTDYYPPRDTATDDTIFSVENLNLEGRLFDVSLHVKRGEILGITGLEGQGQLALARALFGALPADSGTFILKGKPIRIASPSNAIRAGIAYISDDRKGDGLVLIRSTKENIVLPSLKRRTNGILFINERHERTFVNELIDTLAIKVTGPSQVVSNLSGGNQQKIVVAKWLGTEPEVLIVSEPTRGIDVGSKSEIHHIMRDLARRGVGIIMVSSELPEVLGMSDRIAVMAEGRIVAELPGEGTTEENIMAIATRHSLATEGAVTGETLADAEDMQP